MKLNKAVVAILVIVVIALGYFMMKSKDEATMDESAIEQTMEAPSDNPEPLPETPDEGAPMDDAQE